MATIPSGWEPKGKANVRDVEEEMELKGTLLCYPTQALKSRHVLCLGALKPPTRRTDGDTVMKTPKIGEVHNSMLFLATELTLTSFDFSGPPLRGRQICRDRRPSRSRLCEDSPG